jgi:hypothetical protein
MDAVVALVVLGGAVAGLVYWMKLSERDRVAAAQGRAQGHMQHRRSGDYPSSCSWCKNTALARKLFVFERSDGAWHACDVLERLKTCPDGMVIELARPLLADDPRWRRFCTERCANEFFGGERIGVTQPWVGYEYCSVRYPDELLRCPNCGAGKQAA